MRRVRRANAAQLPPLVGLGSVPSLLPVDPRWHKHIAGWESDGAAMAVRARMITRASFTPMVSLFELNAAVPLPPCKPRHVVRLPCTS